ncbi:MAG: S1 RNA-binding domain-containing protein [Oscillospiraceae bacterium]
MQLEIGKVYDGKVKGIAQYGAFVEIEGAGTGMVHISEIANTFVKDVKDYLKENQEVKVKVLSISDDGKIGLSIKKAAENQNEQQQPRAPKPRPERKPNVWEPKKKPPMSELGFEEMLTRFKQNSEEKICALKRNTERKNGSRRK